jgi:hypothetical protein
MIGLHFGRLFRELSSGHPEKRANRRKHLNCKKNHPRSLKGLTLKSIFYSYRLLLLERASSVRPVSMCQFKCARQGDRMSSFIYIFCLANAFISHFNSQTMHVKSFYMYTTALLCFPKNLIPWRDSNPGLLVPERDAMSTAPRHQGDQMSS